MGTIYIKNKRCPFCSKKLKDSITHCPDNINIPCLECDTCKSYFYSNKNYNKLTQLAIKYGQKLNHNVYTYQEISNKKEKKDKTQKQTLKANPKANKIKLKKKSSKSSPIFQNKTLADIPITNIHYLPKKNSTENSNCAYFKKGFCIYIDNKCNPCSVKCYKNSINIKKLTKKDINKTSVQNTFENTISNNHIFNTIKVNAIVLTDNRKCTYNEHLVQDVLASCNAVTPDGIVININIPAAYCATCNQYFVLKRDFIYAKSKGILLCQVEDKTQDYLSKHQLFIYGNESKIHMLGYNVIKKYNYTFKQRKIILANIIENYNITKHEILSIIDINIARHKNQPNYSDAVHKWIQDREFVSNYSLGDCPEISLSKVTIGKRQ